jgi:hypothetical protein
MTKVLGAKELQKTFDKISKEIKQSEKKTLLKILAHIRRNIQRRTKVGRDADNSPFKGYTTGYKKVRAKAGKKISRPNLIWTGRMLLAIKLKLIKHGGKLYFPDTAENDKAVGNDNKREFFALSKKDEEYIMDKLGEPIAKAMR